MSREHVERVRAMHELWNAGDRRFTELSEYVAADVELESPFASVEGAPYRGYSGIERWLHDIDDQFSEWSIAPDELREVADRVLAISTVAFRARASDLTSKFQAAAVFDFAPDGLVQRVQLYLDVEEALNKLSQDG
jgi:hypothetical protein